jgi:REP element-mobilizing transposase RayT
MPLAYFITFSTYGTWLHGTAKGRGSVDRVHNVFGTPFLPPNATREQHARSRMTQPAYLLGVREREIVCAALQELSQERAWNLLAAHVRTNHVHVVIDAPIAVERLMSDFKGRASRNLTLAKSDNQVRHRWTRHGSTRYLFTEAEVARAIRYSLDEQGERLAWFEKDSVREIG